MDDVTKLPHLKPRDGVWYYRRRTPKDVVAAFGKTELIKSLETTDRREAARQWIVVHQGFEDEIEQHRVALAVANNDTVAIGHDVPDAPSSSFEARPQRSGFRYCSKATLKRLERWESGRDRTGRPLTDEAALSLARLYYADGTAWWLNEPENVEAALEEVETEIDMLSDPSDIDTVTRTQQVADLLLDRHGYAGRAGDPGYDVLTHYLRRAMLELARGRRERLLNNFQDQPLDPEIAARRDAAAHVRPNGDTTKLAQFSANALTVQEAADRFWNETKARQGHSPKTDQKYRGALELVVAFLGPQSSIFGVDREQAKGFVHLLERLKANFSKGKKTKSLSQIVAEAQAQEGDGHMSFDSRVMYFRQFREFLEWADAEGMVSVNLKTIKVLALPDDEEKARRAFSPDELKLIFSAPLFTGNAGFFVNTPGSIIDRDQARYWLPLLGLWTGARLGELCQLRVMDVCHSGKGVPFIRITDDERPMTLKTKNARRVVPLHPDLVKLGFLAFVEKQRKARQHWLFKDMLVEDKPNSYRASKEFGAFLNGIGVKTAGICFHSFRHGFAKALKEARVPEQNQVLLCGWSRETMADHYGRDEFADMLYEDVRKVGFEGLDLSHLCASMGTEGSSLTYET